MVRLKSRTVYRSSVVTTATPLFLPHKHHTSSAPPHNLTAKSRSPPHHRLKLFCLFCSPPRLPYSSVVSRFSV
ncbi:hypothetical protein HanOQP8_Chr09g0338591 [Helianthus annuus]|nr:hypothetical protein HanOQP8_Chr09g0338591 [Helianthus annuus]